MAPIPEFREITRADLVRLGPEVFRRLENGVVFLVRGLDEVFALADHVERTLAATVSPECAAEVRAFFRESRSLSEDAAAHLLLVLRELRDSRYVSCLFSDLVAGFDLPPAALIDTGHFRCIFLEHAAALNERAKRGELPQDLFSTEQVTEPEPSVCRQNTGGHPHRDLDAPHYTFQFNFWFPLHDVPATNSLLMFPDVYGADIPYQQEPACLQRPETWGYGRPWRNAMKFGDVLLFHSQHFHASPTEAPHLNRLTIELRVASACQDDNANAYRRLFWNLRNFEALGGEPASERAERLHPRGKRPPLVAQTAHELFASLFPNPNLARRAANLWTPDTLFLGAHKLAAADLLDLTDRLRAAPFAEDRQLGLARYLLLHGRAGLAKSVLADTLARTTSYFFALEIARLAGGAGFWQIAGAALKAAHQLAATSSVQIGHYRGDIPARPVPTQQLLPAEARETALTLAQVLIAYLTAPDTRTVPLLDHRLFFRNFRAAHLFVDGALVFAWSILVYVPPERLASVGLSIAEGADGTRQVTGEFNPEGVARDPAGIVTAYYMSDLLRSLAQRGVLGPGGQQISGASANLVTGAEATAA